MCEYVCGLLAHTQVSRVGMCVYMCLCVCVCVYMCLCVCLCVTTLMVFYIQWNPSVRKRTP